MPKIEYFSEKELLSCIRTQSLTPKRIPVIDSLGKSYQRVLEQNIQIVEDFLAGKIEISPQNLTLMEDLIYTIKMNAAPVIQLRMNRALHFFKEKAAGIKQKQEETEKLLKELEDKKNIEKILNTPKKAQKLHPVLFNKIQSVLGNQKDKTSQKLLNKLQSYAILYYKKNQNNLNKYNPEERKFIQNFNLRFVKKEKITPTKSTFNEKKEVKTYKFEKTNYDNFLIAAEKIQHKIKRFWRKSKNFIYATAIIAGSLFLGKKAYEEINRPISFPKPMTEAEYTKLMQKLDNKKTADFSKEAQNIAQDKIQTSKSDVSKTSEEKQIVKNNSEKDYYDTALEIHLKSEDKVQELYKQINNLVKDNKIEISDELSIKRYAHAFTMYNLIRPNSAENKKIKALLAGENINKSEIAELVQKAGKRGDGVKPDNNSIKFSNFSLAKKQLQQAHLLNLR